MQRGLYSAATGMSAATQWLDVVSHNLANLSTTGYKRDEVAFNEGLDRQMAQNGGTGQNIGTLGSGPTMNPVYAVMEQGAISLTGNRTDMALTTPAGMFAVKTDTGIQYTRNGAFAQDSEGFLTTQTGQKILDRDRKPIQIPAPGAFNVGTGGDITVNGNHLADLAVYDGAFTKAGDNLFTSSSPKLMDTTSVDVRQGALELSNVNPINEMVAMIRLNRAFEMAQKSAQSQDDSTGQLIQALQS